MVSTKMVSFGPHTVLVLLVLVGPTLQQYGATRHRFSGSSAQSTSRFSTKFPHQKTHTDQTYYTLYHTPEVSAEQTPQYSDAFFSEHLINRQLNIKDNLPLFKIKLNSQSHYDQNHEVTNSYDENRQNNENFIDKKYNPAYQGNHLGNIENEMGTKMYFNNRRLKYNNGNNFRTPINYQNNRAYYQNPNMKYTNAQFSHQRNQNNPYYHPKTNTNLYRGINQRHFPYDSLHRYDNKNRRRERIPTNYYTGGSFSYRPNLLQRSSNNLFARESDSSLDFMTGAVGTAAILFATFSAAGLATGTLFNGNSLITEKKDGFDNDLPNIEINDKVIIQDVKSNSKPKIVSRNNQKIKYEFPSPSNESYTYPNIANDHLISHISLPNEEYIQKPNENKEYKDKTNVFSNLKLSTNNTKHTDEIKSLDLNPSNDSLETSSTFSSLPNFETLQTPKTHILEHEEIDDTHNFVHEEIDESPWDYIANVEEETSLFGYQTQKIDKTSETSSYYLTNESNENVKMNSILLSKLGYLQNRDETKVINDFDIKNITSIGSKPSLFDVTTFQSGVTNLVKTNLNSIEEAQSQMVNNNNIIEEISLKSTTKFPYVKPTEVNKVLEFLSNNLSGIKTNFAEIKHITSEEKNSNDMENIEDTSTNLAAEKVPANISPNRISIRLSKKVLENSNKNNEMTEFSSKRSIRSIVSSESFSEDPRGLNEAFNFIMTPFNNMRNYFRSQMEAIGLIAPAKKEETLEKTESEEDKSDDNEGDSSADNQDPENTIVDNTRNVEAILDPKTTDINEIEVNITEESIKTEDSSTNEANETAITNNIGLELSSNAYNEYIKNNISNIQKHNITKVKDNIVYYISTNHQSDKKNEVNQDMNSVATSLENNESNIEDNLKDNASGSSVMEYTISSDNKSPQTIPKNDNDDNVSGSSVMEYTISSDNKSPQTIPKNDNDDIKQNSKWFTVEAYDKENIKLDSYPTSDHVYGKFSTFIPKTPGPISVTKNSENLKDQDMFYSNDFSNFGQGVSPPPMKLITWIVPEDAPTKYQTEAPLSFRYFTQPPTHISTWASVSKNYISKRSKVSSAPLLMKRGPPDQSVDRTGLIENESPITYHTRNILNLNDMSENSQRAYGNEKAIIDDANERSISLISDNIYSTQNVAGRNKIHKGQAVDNFEEKGYNKDRFEDLKSETDMEYNRDVKVTNNKHSDYEDYGLLEKVEEIFARKIYDPIVNNKLFSKKDSSGQSQEYNLLPKPEPLIGSQSFSPFERNDLEKFESNFNHADKQTIMEDNISDSLKDSEAYNNVHIETQSNIDEGHIQNYFDSDSPEKIKNKPTYSVSVSYSTSISTNTDAKKSTKPHLDQHDTSDSSYILVKETNDDDDDDIFDASYTKSSEDIDGEYTNSFENQEKHTYSSSTNAPEFDKSTNIYSLFENVPLLKSNSSESNSHTENEHFSSPGSINSSTASSSGSSLGLPDSSSKNVLESHSEIVGEHSEAVLSMVSFVHSFLCQESQDFYQCVNCLRDNGISATCD